MPALRLAALLLLVVSSVLAAGRAESALRVSPLRTRLEVRPGGHATASISLVNEGPSPVSLRIGLADWTVEGGSVDGVRFHPPGTQPRSCATAVEAWPSALDVAAGGEATVSLAAHLPAEAAGSCFAAVLLETTVGTVAAGEGATARLGLNVAHLVTVDASGRTTFAGEVSGVTVSRPDDTGSLEVLATIRNTGDAGIRPEGSFAVVDASGRLAARIPLGPSFAQPGGEIRLRERWDGRLEPGPYRLVGTLDLGGGLFLTPEVRFRVEDHVEVASFTASVEAGTICATVRLANAGNLTHFLSGEIEVLAKDGRAVSRAQVAPILALPGKETEATVPLPAKASAGSRLALCLSDDRVALAAEAPVDLP